MGKDNINFDLQPARLTVDRSTQQYFTNIAVSLLCQ